MRIRDEFFSIASHELRTPLSALELQAQSIRMQLGRQPVDLERVGAKLEVAQRQVGRLARLITEMLDVSRIEAGRLELDLRGGRPGGADRRGRRALRPGGRARGLPGGAPAPGARDRAVGQVAAGSGRDEPAAQRDQVRPRQARPDLADLRRRDGDPDRGGRGHRDRAEADQRRIFERFERAVSSRQYGGMGVGLFIVDQILRAHDGRIAVRSEPGNGATFVVRLPLRTAGAAPAAADAS